MGAKTQWYYTPPSEISKNTTGFFVVVVAPAGSLEVMVQPRLAAVLKDPEAIRGCCLKGVWVMNVAYYVVRSRNEV